MIPTLELRGSFKLWRYQVSHSVLLVRDPKVWGDASALQTDIMFLDVGALCLPTSLPDPVIRFVDLLTVEANVKSRDLYGSNGFALSGPGWSGWVQAPRLVWCRTHHEAFEPSPMEDGKSGDYEETYFPS